MDKSEVFEDYLEILQLKPDFTKEELHNAMAVATTNATKEEIDRYLDMYIKLTGPMKEDYIKTCLAWRETLKLLGKEKSEPNQTPKLPYGIEIPKIIDEKPCEIFPYATNMGFKVGFSAVTVDDNLEVVLYHPETKAMIYFEVHENGDILNRYNGTPIVHFPIKKEISNGNTVIESVEIKHLPLTDDTIKIVRGHQLSEWPPIENETFSFLNSISDDAMRERIQWENGEDAAEKFIYIRNAQKIFFSDNKMNSMVGGHNTQIAYDTTKAFGESVKDAIEGATGKRR